MQRSCGENTGFNKPGPHCGWAEGQRMKEPCGHISQRCSLAWGRAARARRLGTRGGCSQIAGKRQTMEWPRSCFSGVWNGKCLFHKTRF